MTKYSSMYSIHKTRGGRSIPLLYFSKSPDSTLWKVIVQSNVPRQRSTIIHDVFIGVCWIFCCSNFRVRSFCSLIYSNASYAIRSSCVRGFSVRATHHNVSALWLFASKAKRVSNSLFSWRCRIIYSKHVSEKFNFKIAKYGFCAFYQTGRVWGEKKSNMTSGQTKVVE